MIRRVILWSAFACGISISAHNSSSRFSDEFLNQNQRECFVKRNFVSCVKYKTAKLLWKLATNGLGHFPSEHSRYLTDADGGDSDQTRTIRLVHLEVPSEVQLDMDAKNFQDDNEITKIFKFLQRTTAVFARNHGIQIGISSEGGTRISSSDETPEVEPRSRISRGEKKKRKWLIILPLIILMKIAHLKMTVVPLLLTTLGLNVILIGGGGWLINYLKYKTLCKIHPHFVESHSHVYESEPNEYSSFLGSSGYSNGHTGGGYYTPQDPGPFDKNWSTRKAFHAYNGYKV